MKKSSKAKPTNNLRMRVTLQGAPVEFTAHPCHVPKITRKWDTQLLKLEGDDVFCFLWFNGSYGQYYYFQYDCQWYKIDMMQRGKFLPLVGYSGVYTVLAPLHPPNL